MGGNPRWGVDIFVGFVSAKEGRECDSAGMKDIVELVVVTAGGKRELAGGVGGE